MDTSAGTVSDASGKVEYRSTYSARITSISIDWGSGSHTYHIDRLSGHGTFVIDISETFEQKVKAVECYQSQFDDARFAKVRHFLSGNNAYAGARCGFSDGELFALPHLALYARVDSALG